MNATAGIISRHPREAVGLLAMAAAMSIICINALYFQRGPHPAPIFANKPAAVRAPMSRFVPQGPVATVPAPAPRPQVETASAPRNNDPIAQLLAPSNRVLAVQQVLTQYGYGQIRPTGVAGPETAEAIRKFERSRKLPVTGEISDRVVDALAQMSGHRID